MQTEELQITTQQGDSLYAKIWEPDTSPIAMICIIHGLSEHINRYNAYATFMVNKGICVMGIDQQGHGKSPGKRGHISSYDKLSSNVQSLLIEARLRHDEIPLFLFGQSMGGNIVLNYGMDNKSKELTGLIVSSPLLKLAFDPPKWKTSLGRIMQKIIPSFSIPSDIDPMELSHDPEIGKAYFEDPLNHGKISARLFHILMEGSDRAFREIKSINIPVLLMHGNEDRLTSHEASISLGKLNPLIETRIWQGMRHELHNERGNEEVLKHTHDWLKSKLQ